MTNAVRTIQTQRLMTIGALGLMALMISEPSFAGTGGDAFTDVWDTLKDWTQGTLGRIVAGAMVLVGIVGGIARQSLMAFALGIGGGATIVGVIAGSARLALVQQGVQWICHRKSPFSVLNRRL